MRFNRKGIGVTAWLVMQCYGLPSIIANAETWRKWLLMASGPLWFHWLIVILGFVVLIYVMWPDLKKKFYKSKSSEEELNRGVVDFIGAMGIVDSYIRPATVDMRDGVRLTIKRDFIDRFDKVTGAKLGEYEYNERLLHQWMQSNAARFLIDHRGEMH